MVMNPLITSGIGAIIIGLAHGGLHLFFGDPTSFVAAAVTEVGIGVTIASFFVIFFALTMK